MFVDDRSTISEGATWNIGVIATDGALIWPEADVLPGVTLELISQVHQGRVTTRPVGLKEVVDMRAMFATNAACGVRAINAVDEVSLTTAEGVLTDLRDRYAAIEGELL